MLADHAARVFAVCTRLAAEARGLRGDVERQVGFVKDGVSDEVGEADFSGRDEVEGTLAEGSFEEVFFEFGQLSRAKKGLRVGEVGDVHFGVAVFTRVRVKHELGDGAVQAGKAVFQDGEARAGNFDAVFEVEADVFQVGVLFRWEVKDARRAPAAHFDVVVFVFAGRHAFVRWVGDAGEQGIQRILDVRIFLLTGLLLTVQRADFGHERRDIFAVTLRLTDLRGKGVAPRLQLFGGDLRGFACFFKALVFGEREFVATGFQAFGNGGGVLTQEFAVYHDVFLLFCSEVLLLNVGDGVVGGVVHDQAAAEGVFAVAGEVAVEVVGTVRVEGVNQLRCTEDALDFCTRHAALDAGDVGVGIDVALDDVGFIQIRGVAAAATEGKGKQAEGSKAHADSCG